MSIKKIPVAVIVTFRTTMRRAIATTRIDISARFLERMCDRIEERAEASWNALDAKRSAAVEEAA